MTDPDKRSDQDPEDILIEEESSVDPDTTYHRAEADLQDTSVLSGGTMNSGRTHNLKITTMAYRYLRDSPIRNTLKMAMPSAYTLTMFGMLMALIFFFPDDEFDRVAGPGNDAKRTVTVTSTPKPSPPAPERETPDPSMNTEIPVTPEGSNPSYSSTPTYDQNPGTSGYQNYPESNYPATPLPQREPQNPPTSGGGPQSPSQSVTETTPAPAAPPIPGLLDLFGVKPAPSPTSEGNNPVR